MDFPARVTTTLSPNIANAKYSGGLIKTYIEVRIEILKTNKALVTQNIISLESGNLTTIIINLPEPDLDRAADLEKDIENQKKRVDAARSEASKYSGGLVQALSLTTLATEQYTLALLEHQYYLAKYGKYIIDFPALSTDVP